MSFARGCVFMILASLLSTYVRADQVDVDRYLSLSRIAELRLASFVDLLDNIDWVQIGSPAEFHAQLKRIDRVWGDTQKIKQKLSDAYSQIDAEASRNTHGLLRPEDIVEPAENDLHLTLSKDLRAALRDMQPIANFFDSHFLGITKIFRNYPPGASRSALAQLMFKAHFWHKEVFQEAVFRGNPEQVFRRAFDFRLRLPTPILEAILDWLPVESDAQRTLAGYVIWRKKLESSWTQVLNQFLAQTLELEDPKDVEAVEELEDFWVQIRWALESEWVEFFSELSRRKIQTEKILALIEFSRFLPESALSLQLYLFGQISDPDRLTAHIHEIYARVSLDLYLQIEDASEEIGNLRRSSILSLISLRIKSNAKPGPTLELMWRLVSKDPEAVEDLRLAVLALDDLFEQQPKASLDLCQRSIPGLLGVADFFTQEIENDKSNLNLAPAIWSSKSLACANELELSHFFTMANGL